MPERSLFVSRMPLAFARLGELTNLQHHCGTTCPNFNRYHPRMFPASSGRVARNATRNACFVKTGDESVGLRLSDIRVPQMRWRANDRRIQRSHELRRAPLARWRVAAADVITRSLLPEKKQEARRFRPGFCFCGGYGRSRGELGKPSPLSRIRDLSRLPDIGIVY